MDELLELISQSFGDNTEEASKVKNAVATKMQTLKDDWHSKDQENLKMRNDWKDAGYDKDKHATRKEFIDELKTTSTKAVEAELTLNGLNDKFIASESRLEQALSQVNTLVSEKTAIEKDAKTTKIKSAFTEKLSGAVYGYKGQVDSIMYRHGDSMTVEGDEIKVGGKSFDEFVSGFLEDNKDIQILEQKTGNESVGGDGTAGGGDDMVSQMKAQMTNIG